MNLKTSLGKRVIFVLHLAFLAHHTFASIYGIEVVCKPMLKHKLEKVKQPCTFTAAYLTNWNLAFQIIFLCLAVILDAIELYGLKVRNTKKIQYFNDLLYLGLVWPFTMTMASYFWLLYYIDRELVFPSALDLFVPSWINHSVHTVVFAVLLVETIFQPRMYPVNRKTEMWLCGTFTVAYAIVYHGIYFIDNRWLYGVHGLFNLWQAILFQLSMWTVKALSYEAQFYVTRLIHGNLPNEEELKLK